MTVSVWLILLNSFKLHECGSMCQPFHGGIIYDRMGTPHLLSCTSVDGHIFPLTHYYEHGCSESFGTDFLV